MSQTLVLERPHIHHGTTRPLRQAEAAARTDTRSLSAAILSTLLMSLAGRVSFVLLGFYLGEHFTSATLVAVVLEAFYLSELAVGAALPDHRKAALSPPPPCITSPEI